MFGKALILGILIGFFIIPFLLNNPDQAYEQGKEAWETANTVYQSVRSP